MSEIISAVQPPNTNQLWYAGFAYRDNDGPENGKLAVVMKMDDDGEIKFVK
jgi:hypothetical protein